MIKPENLLPPKPDQYVGWGRFKWILSHLSTSPLEIKLGFGAMWRGLWSLTSNGLPPDPHAFHWDGMLSLHTWGLIVFFLGFTQFFGCIYRWGRIRTWSATLLAYSLAYIFGKYLLNEPGNIAVPLYGTLMVGETWIAFRGWPVFGGKPLNGARHEP